MFWVGFISSLLFFVIMYKSVVRIKTLRYGYVIELKINNLIFFIY